MSRIYEAIGRLQDWSNENPQHRILMLVQDSGNITISVSNFTGFLLAGIMQKNQDLAHIILEAEKIYEKRNKHE